MAKSDVVLGEEKEGAEAEPGVAGVDAVGLAVAMDAARYDPELARKAGNYLEEQHRLVKLQIKHFDEERRLAIAAAKRKRFADRIRNTISAGLLLILGGALLGTAWVVGDAVASKQVIVAPFELSPTLAARSLNGKIVAVGLLDDLNPELMHEVEQAVKRENLKVDTVYAMHQAPMSWGEVVALIEKSQHG